VSLSILFEWQPHQMSVAQSESPKLSFKGFCVAAGASEIQTSNQGIEQQV